MLSTFVLLPAARPPALGPLVRTLGALVPAIVEGLVRDVTVIAPGADGGVQGVAEHAGCALVEDASFAEAWRRAVAGARCTTVFALRAGAFLDRGLLEEIGRRLGAAPEPAAVRPLLVREAPRHLVTRLLPDLAPVAGLIGPRASLATPAASFERLVRRQRSALTLQARAVMAG